MNQINLGKGWGKTHSFYQACAWTHFVEKIGSWDDKGKLQSVCSSTPLIPCSADPRWVLCPVNLVPSKVSRVWYHLCTAGSHMEKGRIFCPESPQETRASNASSLFAKYKYLPVFKNTEKVNSSKPGSGAQTVNTAAFSEPAGAVLLKFTCLWHETLNLIFTQLLTLPGVLRLDWRIRGISQ